MGNYLTFSSTNSFTLNTYEETKKWNGTLEYSFDAINWYVWNGGATVLSADNGILHLRGTGNSVISGHYVGEVRGTWVFTGSDISCTGNIENLLDYKTVARGEHPTMGEMCFAKLFDGCRGLISAPSLPAVELSSGCYLEMFSYCTNLKRPPALPATVLADHCYYSMFRGSGLESLPALPDIPFPHLSCKYLFASCKSIKISTVQTEEYKYPFKVPPFESGETDYRVYGEMFKYTSGTFTGTPSANTTYYTSNKVIYAEEEEPEEPTTATVITYNGETIATLEAGQKATIKAAEYEFEHDIVFKAGGGGGSSGGGEQPTLFPPSISLDGDILTITPNADNGAFATSYDLYDNGVPVGNYTSTVIDMSTLSLPSGVRHYTVKAKGEHFNDSAESNEVTRVTTLGDIMKSADGSTLTSSDGYKISVKKG